MPKYTNVSSPAAYGAEWEQDGSRYQLVAVRGGYNLRLGIKPAGGYWNHLDVDYPERFTDGKPVRSWAAMQRVVRRWFEWRITNA